MTELTDVFPDFDGFTVRDAIPLEKGVSRRDPSPTC